MSFRPTITRAAQLEPGDLFIFADSDGRSVAILATDPTDNGQKLIVALGPEFPAAKTIPALIGRSDKTVISFGREYKIRLPCEPHGWITTEPAPEIGCLAVTDAGIFVRAHFDTGREPGRLYVNTANGEICANLNSHQFTLPPGIKAFAVEWDLLTTEEEPRTIISYPLATRETPHKA